MKWHVLEHPGLVAPMKMKACVIYAVVIGLFSVKECLTLAVAMEPNQTARIVAVIGQ